MRSVPAPNARELRRYLGRIGDRWPLQLAMIGGRRVADMRPAPAGPPAPDSGGGVGPAAPAPAAGRPQPEHIIVLVSDGFDGMPWLERVHQAGSLWDTLEMGGPAEIHCYTPTEYLRRRETTPVVREVAEHGVLLFADSGAFTSAGG